MGGICVALLVGVAVGAIGSMRAAGITAKLKSELETKTAELQSIEDGIPETQTALDNLAQGKGQLVEQNLELKICNHASAPLKWIWLNVARFDAENGRFTYFDTAYDTQWEYLYYNESIPPAGTFSGGGWVVGEERVWDGSALFFAAAVRAPRTGSPPVRGDAGLRGGDCYPLNLDR